jgi:hypothetical protein
MTRTDLSRTLLGPTLLALALAVLCTVPAAAEVYHVELANGERFDSRYPPEEASWDGDLLLFHTETGNWAGIRRDEVVRVTIETELRGAGQRIDATTIYMGRTANAAPPPGTEEEVDPSVALLQAIYDQNQAQESYTIEQFVEPSAIGGGIPVGFTQQTTPPVGIPSQNPNPQ